MPIVRSPQNYGQGIQVQMPPMLRMPQIPVKRDLSSQQFIQSLGVQDDRSVVGTLPQIKEFKQTKNRLEGQLGELKSNYWNFSDFEASDEGKAWKEAYFQNESKLDQMRITAEKIDSNAQLARVYGSIGDTAVDENFNLIFEQDEQGKSTGNLRSYSNLYSFQLEEGGMPDDLYSPMDVITPHTKTVDKRISEIIQSAANKPVSSSFVSYWSQGKQVDPKNPNFSEILGNWTSIAEQHSSNEGALRAAVADMLGIEMGDVQVGDDQSFTAEKVDFRKSTFTDDHIREMFSDYAQRKASLGDDVSDVTINDQEFLDYVIDRTLINARYNKTTSVMPQIDFIGGTGEGAYSDLTIEEMRSDPQYVSDNYRLGDPLGKQQKIPVGTKTQNPDGSYADTELHFEKGMNNIIGEYTPHGSESQLNETIRKGEDVFLSTQGQFASFNGVHMFIGNSDAKIVRAKNIVNTPKGAANYSDGIVTWEPLLGPRGETLVETSDQVTIEVPEGDPLLKTIIPYKAKSKLPKGLNASDEYVMYEVLPRAIDQMYGSDEIDYKGFNELLREHGLEELKKMRTESGDRITEKNIREILSRGKPKKTKEVFFPKGEMQRGSIDFTKSQFDRADIPDTGYGYDFGIVSEAESEFVGDPIEKLSKEVMEDLGIIKTKAKSYKFNVLIPREPTSQVYGTANKRYDKKRDEVNQAIQRQDSNYRDLFPTKQQ